MRSPELAALAAAWTLERVAARARAAEERRGVPLAERVARGTALRDLSLDETAPAPGGRTRVALRPRRRDDLDGTRLGPGDPVRLWRDDPDEAGTVPAVLASVERERIWLVVDDAEPLEEGRVHLDREDPEVTFDRGAAAIRRLDGEKGGASDGRLRDLLTLRRDPEPRPPAAFTPLDPELHAAQLAAVAEALSGAELTLIHGPPGTGKTRTLVEVVRQAVARGERVLCAAASNTAVDNLAERLAAADVPVVRLGHPARVAPAVLAVTLDVLLERSEAHGLARRWNAEARALRDRARKRRARGGDGRELLAEAARLARDARQHLGAAQQAILERARVICQTAAGTDVDDRFDLVVLDEATQAVDPVALCALLRGRRAVLAGDPCQLPPTVIDPAAVRAGLGVTFFERLAARHPPSLLIEQHRMHRALMAFPSASMYGGRLVAAPAVAEHRLEDLGVAADPLRPGPLVVVDTAGRGWDDERAGDDASTRNPGHAARVAAEVRRLLGRGLPPTDLAVITPYDAQVRLLRELLAAERDAGLEIGTVDGFQGREKEAVVLDLVRSNLDGELGFLADTRRMNVALTRARRFLLVVADSATLGGHPYYRAFLEHADGVTVSAWADEAPPW